MVFTFARDLLSFFEKNKNKETYNLKLAKGNNTNISKDYYKGTFFNYDKALFCTKLHKGVNIDDIPNGIYLLKISILMNSGHYDQTIVRSNKKINIEFNNKKYLQILHTDDLGNIFYTKKSIIQPM